MRTDDDEDIMDVCLIIYRFFYKNQKDKMCVSNMILKIRTEIKLKIYML